MDKGYYDYDFEAVKPKPTLTAEDKEIWSSEKLNAILGVRPKDEATTLDELQTIVMNEEKLKRKK